MSFEVHDALERLGDAFVDEVVAETGQLPAVPHDPDWPSPCVVEHDQVNSLWRPVAREIPPDFSGLQRALETPVHVDLLTYFGSFWSGPLPVQIHDNPFELLQIWNDEDFDNLVSNFIGHALEKRRIRQPLTLFFALVDDSRFLSVHNETGEVLLETLGAFEPETVNASLGGFLAEVSHRLPDA